MKRTSLAVSALSVLALAGCTGSDKPESSESGGSKSKAPSTSQTFKLVGFEAKTVAVPDAPLGTIPTSIPNVMLETYVLKREGDAVVVVFALHNTTQDVARGLTYTSLSEGTDDFTVGGVSLVDPTGLKQYLVLRPEGVKLNQALTTPCACSAAGLDNALAADEHRYFTALVTAPPTEVTKVSFVTPIGTVADQTIDA